MIEDGGIPVEFIETTLSEDEIWDRAQKPGFHSGVNPATIPQIKKPRFARGFLLE